jgi:hypothetical protein
MELVDWFRTFTAETWVAFAAAGIAVVALYFTGIAAKAAKDQTKIQGQLRIDAAQPYVWADMRENRESGSMLQLEVGNSGPTVATNVRVNISMPLPSSSVSNENRLRGIEKRLAEGIRSLAPGRVITWTLGVGHQILAEEGGRSYTFTIDADGPFGPLETLSYTADLDDWRSMRDQPSGTLHTVRKSIDSLTKQIEKSTAATLRQFAGEPDA